MTDQPSLLDLARVALLGACCWTAIIAAVTEAVT